MTSPLAIAMLAAAATWAAPAFGQLEQITSREAVAGLKAALEKGSQAAVSSLGRTDGFFRNPRVKIPLPDSLARAEKLMRRVGMDKYADELILTMNRAAEVAVPEARRLFTDAVGKMTVRDAKTVLTGGDTAGTEYFQRATRGQLHASFLPIVKQATGKVRLARKYNQFAARGARLGLVEEGDADLDEYVTQKALDGLFLVVAEEEKKIRKDPVRAGTRILRKVFGALQ